MKYKWTATPARWRGYDWPAWHYECEMKSDRCTAINDDGTRCSRRVVIGKPMCWIHSRSQMKLAVKNSTIPNAGKGLFAIRTKKKGLTETQLHKPVFRKNENIAKYTGDVVTEAELDARYGGDVNYTAPYALLMNGVIIDAGCNRGIASIANHKPPSQANSEFTETGKIRATKNIYDGREIFVDYGPNYQFHPNVTAKVVR